MSKRKKKTNKRPSAAQRKAWADGAKRLAAMRNKSGKRDDSGRAQGKSRMASKKKSKGKSKRKSSSGGVVARTAKRRTTRGGGGGGSMRSLSAWKGIALMSVGAVAGAVVSNQLAPRLVALAKPAAPSAALDMGAKLATTGAVGLGLMLQIGRAHV